VTPDSDPDGDRDPDREALQRHPLPFAHTIGGVTLRSASRCLGAATALAVLGCGSRTGLDPPATSSVSRSDASLGHVVDARADTRPRKGDAALHDSSARVDAADAGPSEDAGRFLVCPAAVLSGSPLPMLGNCSTRDGRARVTGPTSPHVTWVTPAPPTLTIGGFVAADTTGAVYLAAAPDEGLGGLVPEMIPTFGRIDGTTGNLDWLVSLPASTSASLSPILDPGGALLDVANNVAGPAIDSFDPMTGSVTASMLAFSLAGIGIPAVGVDGSLYVQYVFEVGTNSQQALVSKLLPDRTIAWTTGDLSAGPTSFGGFLTLALAERDVVIAVTTDTSGSLSIMYGLSPATGATLWTTQIRAEAVNGPAIGPDGSIAVVALDATNPNAGLLYVFEPTGALRSTTVVPGQTVAAIGVDGTIVIGGEGLTAVSPSGTVLWTNSVGLVLGATIDSAGTIVTTFESEIVGFDVTTGAMRWSLMPPPHVPTDAQPPCLGVQSVVLTSNGGLVGLGCGLLFGASD